MELLLIRNLLWENWADFNGIGVAMASDFKAAHRTHWSAFRALKRSHGQIDLFVLEIGASAAFCECFGEITVLGTSIPSNFLKSSPDDAGDVLFSIALLWIVVNHHRIPFLFIATFSAWSSLQNAQSLVDSTSEIVLNLDEENCPVSVFRGQKLIRRSK